MSCSYYFPTAFTGDSGPVTVFSICMRRITGKDELQCDAVAICYSSPRTETQIGVLRMFNFVPAQSCF